MVATGNKYDIIDPETGKLDRRIFVDQDVYDDEMEKIFGRAWQMVAHTSLVPNKNDFFLSYIGEDPVIVTRDEDDQLHVLLNVCRHRGNRVARTDEGNSVSFLCTYHGWTFDNKGCLGHVPGEQEAFHDELNKKDLGLIEAKVDTYAGIIFATWDHEAPSLEAYLGDARWYLDTIFNRSDAGMVALGPQKWMEPCNWKSPVDNCSDNYHVPISHWSSTYARHTVQGLPLRTMKDNLKHPQENKHVFVNGHALTFMAKDEDGVLDGGGLLTGPAADLQREFSLSKQEEVDRRLGTYRAKRLQLRNHSLFPNGVLGFRLAFPRGPFKTEFWHFALVEADAPEEVKRARSIASAANNGAAGLNEQDDMDNWGQVTEASRSVIARRFPAVLSMGAGHSGPHDEWPGQVADRYISESNQRGFYSRWTEFMNADSWSDIPIEPMTAQFDGTATMHS